MSKEKKKYAAVSELIRGTGCLLLGSPIILFALFGAANIVLFGLNSPNMPSLVWVISVGLLLFMLYVLFRFAARWQLLARFVRRVRQEYFRVMAMQERNTDRLDSDATDTDEDSRPFQTGQKRHAQTGQSD